MIAAGGRIETEGIAAGVRDAAALRERFDPTPLHRDDDLSPRRAARLPCRAGPRRRHVPLRVPEEVRPQLRRGPPRHRDSARASFETPEAPMADAGFTRIDITDDAIITSLII